jgi:predicted alpha/beta hydrolase family esterase
LTLPGINGSGAQHWQTIWEFEHDNVRRITQQDWARPDSSDWLAAIEDAVRVQPIPPILVAHSLGCIAAVQWLANTQRLIHGALLVAIPDPAGKNFPKEAKGFSDLPDLPGGTRLIVVGSENDPYACVGFSKKCATRWGAEYVNAGPAGHINDRTPMGAWLEGWFLVRSWR